MSTAVLAMSNHSNRPQRRTSCSEVPGHSSRSASSTSLPSSVQAGGSGEVAAPPLLSALLLPSAPLLAGSGRAGTHWRLASSVRAARASSESVAADSAAG